VQAAITSHREWWTSLDTFFSANLALSFTVWLRANRAVYFSLVADGRALEFFFFTGALLVAIGALWISVRCYTMPWPILMVVEATLLMHFAGGWIHFGGLRLYGHVIAGIRFDKFVHLLASFAVASVLMEFVRIVGMKCCRFVRILAALGAFGFGAGVEVYEYLVTRTMPTLTTARFEDSLRDLLADVAGATVWLALHEIRAWRSTMDKRRVSLRKPRVEVTLREEAECNR